MIAVGVVVVGQLFGFVGLIVAVPILSMLVILIEELWIGPLEESERQRPNEGMVTLPASVGEAEGEPFTSA